MPEEHPLLDELVKQFALEIDRVYNIQATWVSIEFLGSERAISIYVGNIKSGCQSRGPNKSPKGNTLPLDPIDTQEHPTMIQAKEGDAFPDRHSECISDILAMIEKAKKPMTTTRILEALSKAGKEWGRRTVDNYLSLLVKEGTLVNPEDAYPRGYRVPETTSGDQ